MARGFGPLAALASGLAHSCEEQVAQVAWLERSAEVACVVLEQLDFLKLLWFCEELVVSRACLEHAGGVVSFGGGRLGGALRGVLGGLGVRLLGGVLGEREEDGERCGEDFDLFDGVLGLPSSSSSSSTSSSSDPYGNSADEDEED